MEFFSQNGITSAASDTIIVVLLALFTLASVAALIVFLCKYAEDGAEVKHRFSALAVILFVGFAVRLVFALCITGYRSDYKLFTSMFDDLAKNGLGDYYSGDASGVLYPVVYFVYLIFGGLSNAMGINDFALGAQFTAKLPLIIADLLSAYAVYKIAYKYFNARIALVLCSFVCVSPIFFVGSAIWTSPIVFTAMFLCFACYFLARKKCACTIAFATAAAFSSKEGIFAFPVLAVFCGYHFVRAIINIRRDAPKGGEVLASDYRAVISVPVGLVVSLAVAYVIGLLEIAPHYGFFSYLYEFLIRPLARMDYFTYNGLSVYALFGNNGARPDARFPSWLFACLFGVILVALTCVVYFTKRNRATVVMLVAYSMFTVQIYYPNSTAIGMQSVLILVAAAYALVRDKRLITVLAVTGIVYVINSLSVIASAGYLNNLADYRFTDASYTGSTLLSGALQAIPIVCSAIAALAHVYFTIVAVNVGMTGQKRELLHCNSGIGACFKEFLFGRRVK
ncbi:MAG: hypothetical protein NC184_01520 [Roseburia sp.]|nr:hypothetical protein [Roseburia sp.]